ncbi:hypothetical protein BJ138DRAFT_1163463 [Hygrophoropsis aurantiaca]|uniref:Uncharacterized protein n=1 Tax=Hygrophoropsis aurantiaca TaxID=72124 RepID=A0ACB7ZYF2_9AGAM|nr:hypothetical protein BJ138DRAFT_1163463 [Hygrophoropsis aurantiaca]
MQMKTGINAMIDCDRSNLPSWSSRKLRRRGRGREGTRLSWRRGFRCSCRTAMMVPFICFFVTRLTDIRSSVCIRSPHHAYTCARPTAYIRRPTTRIRHPIHAHTYACPTTHTTALINSPHQQLQDTDFTNAAQNVRVLLATGGTCTLRSSIFWGAGVCRVVRGLRLFDGCVGCWDWVRWVVRTGGMTKRR